MRARNSIIKSLIASSSVKSFTFFPRLRYSTTPLSQHTEIIEKRAKDNAAITLVKKKTHDCNEILLQLTENKLIPVSLQDRVKNLLSTHQPKFNEFKHLLDKEITVIKNLENLLDGLTSKRKRAQDTSIEVEKNIITLLTHLTAADNDLKKLKRELKITNDGKYIPAKDFHKDELLLKHTLNFNDSCELISAICAETNAQSYPFLTPEKEDTLKQYLQEHGSKSYENLRLKIWDKEKFIRDCTKELELRTRERDLVARKIHLVDDQISMLNSQLSKLNKQASQLQELAAMSFSSFEPEPLVESHDSQITKFGAIKNS